MLSRRSFLTLAFLADSPPCRRYKALEGRVYRWNELIEAEQSVYDGIMEAHPEMSRVGYDSRIVSYPLIKTMNKLEERAKCLLDCVKRLKQSISS